jgi:hypothetical protein
MLGGGQPKSSRAQFGITAGGSPAQARPEKGDDVEVPDYRSLDGVEVTNQDGERLGRIHGLFIDDQLEVPTWVAVHSGLFGTHHALLPLAQARFVDGRLLVPYSKDDLALAPHHDPDQRLTAEQEQALFAHYNVGYSDADAPGAAHRRRGASDRPHRLPRRRVSPGGPGRGQGAGARPARRPRTTHRAGLAAATALPTSGGRLSTSGLPSRSGGWRVYAAAGHHLDDVDAAVGAFLDGPGRVVEALYLAPCSDSARPDW